MLKEYRRTIVCYYMYDNCVSVPTYIVSHKFQDSKIATRLKLLDK